ncbi:SLAP domain-containing protein (plasmid) [Lactobacillus sp. ESL0731]|uniref:SLAP domain-containing protein n=1 Tax=unclassified Lactobacillus TaxID=2620435 RepID=UPI0023FA3ADD|nr:MULTISPECIES: SLAP domain-containing protein [unclassified Lactobacillus]WEV52095.1 SLAP domain-containing protein [Lactobacillus sp. ESL0700]WEV63214.1 SLAP domain-containing protein [Lactobacillus sp. ESL0731]
MKKKVLISLASAALLSVGAIGITDEGNFAPQTVQAAKKAKTFKIKLTKNAKVFTKYGKRKSKKLLKKGHTFTAYGKKTIHGKKYYRLSKGRYIKAVNAKKTNIVEVSNPTPINTGSSSSTGSNTSTSKGFTVTVIKPAVVYYGNGEDTMSTLMVGAKRTVTGTKTIRGKKYYQIDTGKYILASCVTTSNNPKLPSANDNKQNNGSWSTDENGWATPSHQEKPTQSQIDHLLANNKYSKEKTIYFSDDELTQIKDYLWQDIQNHRVENGLPKYKNSSEINDFLSKVTSSMTSMYTFESHLNETTAGQLATYLPNLAENGMNISDSFDDLDYYGRPLEGYSQPKAFDFNDRNPEHVAKQIFTSFKDDSDYNKMILGHGDKKAFAGIALYYDWKGDDSAVGVAFIEVSGNSSKWNSYYAAN